ncbi:MAG: hypothetical protein UY04_C0016G0010 [Parcubacteria group bacterium GW2011_GWA2_47_7]|nr:MAG: hypothetical protein UY04_C0016G0010 [Parcubacteria group bacterium GW2011_GWA2_47_7]
MPNEGTAKQKTFRKECFLDTQTLSQCITVVLWDGQKFLEEVSSHDKV